LTGEKKSHTYISDRKIFYTKAVERNYGYFVGHYATSWKVVELIPDEVTAFFN
jgi:hypothetical protein